jgi:O-antigen/teichoic acid export membrane protein
MIHILSTPKQMLCNLSKRVRHDKRLIMAMRTIVASFFSRTIMIIAPLVTIPATMGYLGDTRFGLWMAITSLLAMMVFADLGVGNGVLTEISKLKGCDDREGMQKVISTAYFVLGCSSLFALIAFFSMSTYIPWGKLINAKDAAIAADAKIVGVVCFSCFFLNIPLNLISKIQLGLQKGYINELWMSISSIAGMGLTLAAVHFKAPLGILVLCVAGTPLLFLLLNTWVFFYRNAGKQYLSVSHVNLRMAKTIFTIGSQFLILSLLLTLSLNCDNLIVAHVMGLDKVSHLEITSKPIKMAFMLVSLLCMPFWSANGEALAKGEYAWVRGVTRKMVILCGGMTLVAIVLLIIVSPVLFHWWIGPNFHVDRWLLISLGLWAVLLAFAAPFFMVLNSSGQVIIQIKMWLIFLPVAFACKILFSRTFGLPGIPLGGTIPYALIIIPWCIAAYLKIVGKPDLVTVKA